MSNNEVFHTQFECKKKSKLRLDKKREKKGILIGFNAKKSYSTTILFAYS
jgi:hypothetical protein